MAGNKETSNNVSKTDENLKKVKSIEEMPLKAESDGYCTYDNVDSNDNYQFTDDQEYGKDESYGNETRNEYEYDQSMSTDDNVELYPYDTGAAWSNTFGKSQEKAVSNEPTSEDIKLSESRGNICNRGNFASSVSEEITIEPSPNTDDNGLLSKGNRRSSIVGAGVSEENSAAGVTSDANYNNMTEKYFITRFFPDDVNYYFYNGNGDIIGFPRVIMESTKMLKRMLNKHEEFFSKGFVSADESAEDKVRQLVINLKSLKKSNLSFTKTFSRRFKDFFRRIKERTRTCL